MHEGDEFGFGSGRTWFQNDTRLANFAPFFVRHAHDSAHVNGRMLIQHPLDFRRIHVLTARNEHILLAIHHVEVPIFVVAHQIAGVEPALVVIRSGRGFGIVPVTGATAGAFEDQFAHFVGAEGPVVVVHHAHIHKVVGTADTARFANCIFGREGKEARAVFGHAEALLELDAFLPLVLFDQRDG